VAAQREFSDVCVSYRYQLRRYRYIQQAQFGGPVYATFSVAPSRWDTLYNPFAETGHVECRFNLVQKTGAYRKFDLTSLRNLTTCSTQTFSQN